MSRLRGFFAKVLNRELPDSELEGREPNAQKPPAAPALSTQVLKQRADAAIDMLMGNAALTSDLMDDAATILLDWGSACVRYIVRATANLDDGAAEDAMAPRLRALRRMMRLINRWASEQPDMDIEKSSEMLKRILEQADIVYDQTFSAFPQPEREVFLNNLATSGLSAPDAITRLRAFIDAAAQRLAHTMEASRGQNPQ